jgi:hypothetical protein
VPRVDDRRERHLLGIAVECTAARPAGALLPTYPCYNRFVRWRKAGMWHRLMGAITSRTTVTSR